MAFSQTDIDNLKRAIASGVLTVEIEGKRVSYRSMEDLERALARAEAEVNGSSSSYVTQSVAAFTRD